MMCETYYVRVAVIKFSCSDRSLSGTPKDPDAEDGRQSRPCGRRAPAIEQVPPVVTRRFAASPSDLIMEV